MNGNLERAAKALIDALPELRDDKVIDGEITVTISAYLLDELEAAANPRATAFTLLDQAQQYLSHIPETAAGGDDDAVALCRKIRKYLGMKV